MISQKMYNFFEQRFRKKRGFGFVEMFNNNSEKIAIDDLQDIEWMGREIKSFMKLSKEIALLEKNSSYDNKEISALFLFLYLILHYFMFKNKNFSKLYTNKIDKFSGTI